MDEVTYMIIEGVSVFGELPKAKYPALVENHHVRCVIINSVNDLKGNDLTAVKRLVEFSNMVVAVPPGPASTDQWPVDFLDRAVHGVVRYG